MAKQNENNTGKTKNTDTDVQDSPSWDGLMGWCVLEGMQ